MKDGVMHATIHTESAHAAEIVRNALDDLRERMNADGLQTGQLNVDDRGNRPREDQPNARSPQPEEAGVNTEVPIATVEPASDALLDVRM